MCGVCMVKKMMKLKKENEDLKKKVECMRNIDEQRKEACVYEGSKSLKTWAIIATILIKYSTGPF